MIDHKIIDIKINFAKEEYSMSMFSEYLHTLIQSRDISISKLSRDSGVERTTIHKALTGERILPYQAVKLLTYYLKLSPKESQRLQQYYSLLFESASTGQVRDIIDKMFLRISDLMNIRLDSLHASADNLLSNLVQEKNTYRGHKDILCLIQWLMAEEIKFENPKVEMALPAGMVSIEENILKLYQGNSYIEISHIVCFDASKSSSEYKLCNMECLSHSLPECILSDAQYHVYYYYGDVVQTKYTDPLPYFLVTHSGAVGFSENCQIAILFKEKEQIEYFRAYFYQLKKSCHRLVEYVENPVEVLKPFEENSMEYCSIMSLPYVRNMEMGKFTTIFSQRGILQFLKTGYDFFTGIADCFSESQRRTMLYTLLDAIRYDRIKGRIVNDIAFDLSDDLVMLTSAKQGVLLCTKNGNWGMRISEPSLCQDLYDWSIHFSNSDRVYDKEKTIEFFAECLNL